MKDHVMNLNYTKTFKRIALLFIILAVVTAVAIPLSLSCQITPLNAVNYAIIGGLGMLWAVLALYYWLAVVAWLYKSAVNEGMNKSLWPILGLFLNLFAVMAFCIVRNRPAKA